MAVEADFSFLRKDLATTKEWSVDLTATWFHVVQGGGLGFELRCLFECKYRSPNKHVLLIPDPNTLYSPGTIGGTVSIFDQFYHSHISSEPLTKFEERYPFAYKIVELHDKGANEQDFRHAAQQIRYSLPVLVRETLDDAIGTHPDETMPHFIAPIIVTNAPLRMLHDSIGIEDIIKTKSIDQISSKVDCAILYSRCGPDYADHVRFIFESGNDERIKYAESVMQRIIARGKIQDNDSDGQRLIRQISEGNSYEARKFASQFFVCNYNYLEEFLRGLKKACRNAFRTKSKTSHTTRRVRRLIRAKSLAAGE